MKCDELRIENACVYGPDAKVYLAEQVDAAIAELKDKVKFCSDFELAARKDIKEMRGQHQMLKQFGHYKLSPVPGHMINHEMRYYVSYNVVCMIINHLEAELRATRRALWLARAERAKAMYTYWHVKCIEKHLLYEHKWIVVERLCRAKADEFKEGK